VTATITGTMLTPGVSRNGRLYTPELIVKAHDRLKERLAEGSMPVTMLTHHAAGDDSTKIVGQVTGVALDGENLTFTAEMAPTSDARTIGQLVGGKRPFLRNVSIRGAWLGPVETRTYEGQKVETADDMEIDGLDFTKNPGVTGAVINATTEAAAHLEHARAAQPGRAVITETVDEVRMFTETAPTPRAATFADPGYAPDRIRRYPTTTETDARQSWTRISEDSSCYTPNQLKRIKGRIRSALTKHGADMTETTTPTTPVVEATVRLSDVTECYMDGGSGTAGFSISAYNGPLTVSVSAYNGIEPADLAGVAQAAMTAAMQAVKSMDPDTDGDIDAGSVESDDNAMETVAPTPSTAVVETNAAPVAPTVKEPTVADTAPQVVEGAPTDAPPTIATTAPVEAAPAASVAPDIDYAKLAAAVVAATAPTAAAPAEAAPTEALTEATVTATLEQIAESEKTLREAIKAELIDEMRKSGTLGRKGLIESLAPAEKPLHEMNNEEWTKYRNENLAALIPAVREQ
jgi:hypothetical protein